MRKCDYCLTLGVGGGLCGIAVLAGQAFEFGRPSDIACSSPPRVYRDFGPPPGCDDGKLPDNKSGWITSVASSAASVAPTGAIFVNSPLVAFTARDAEDAADEPDQRPTIHSVEKSS
jgi:hypothetical protein